MVLLEDWSCEFRLVHDVGNAKDARRSRSRPRGENVENSRGMGSAQTFRSSKDRREQGWRGCRRPSSGTHDISKQVSLCLLITEPRNSTRQNHATPVSDLPRVFVSSAVDDCKCDKPCRGP